MDKWSGRVQSQTILNKSVKTLRRADRCGVRRDWLHRTRGIPVAATFRCLEATNCHRIPPTPDHADPNDSRVFRSCPLDGTDETHPFYARNECSWLHSQ
jgi:hypothetical protein